MRTMLKTAKIPTGPTLENFDFAFQPAIETLATGAWIRNSEVVLIRPARRKSHLLCGLGIRAIQLGFSVQYFRFDELLTALRAAAHLPPMSCCIMKFCYRLPHLECYPLGHEASGTVCGSMWSIAPMSRCTACCRHALTLLCNVEIWCKV